MTKRDDEDRVGRLERATDDARSVVRELHEAMQDARTLLRELRQAADAGRAELDRTVNDRIGEAVAAGLSDYRDTLGEAIDKATEATFARFDRLTDELLGEGWRNRRKGETSLADLFRDAAHHQGPPPGAPS